MVGPLPPASPAEPHPRLDFERWIEQPLTSLDLIALVAVPLIFAGIFVVFWFWVPPMSRLFFGSAILLGGPLISLTTYLTSLSTRVRWLGIGEQGILAWSQRAIAFVPWAEVAVLPGRPEGPWLLRYKEAGVESGVWISPGQASILSQLVSSRRPDPAALTKLSSLPATAPSVPHANVSPAVSPELVAAIVGNEARTIKNPPGQRRLLSLTVLTAVLFAGFLASAVSYIGGITLGLFLGVGFVPGIAIGVSVQKWFETERGFLAALGLTMIPVFVAGAALLHAASLHEGPGTVSISFAGVGVGFGFDFGGLQLALLLNWRLASRFAVQAQRAVNRARSKSRVA